MASRVTNLPVANLIPRWSNAREKASENCSHGFEVDPHLSYRETYPDAGDGIYVPARNHLVVGCKDPQA
jgi:hypothetical protein